MKIEPIITKIITSDDSIVALIDKYIKNINDNSVLLVTSKILSICQGDVVEGNYDKVNIIKNECEWYIDTNENKFGSRITITGKRLAVAAGVDESNSDGKLVLLPSNVQNITNKVWVHVKQKYKLNSFAVIVTDSRSLALSLGSIGMSISYCGIKPMTNYIGNRDLFGREILHSRLNNTISLAAAGVFVMGEGAESIPMAVISELPTDIFVNTPPSSEELIEQYYDINDDLYDCVLGKANWHPGGNGYLKRQLR